MSTFSTAGASLGVVQCVLAVDVVQQKKGRKRGSGRRVSISRFFFSSIESVHQHERERGLSGKERGIASPRNRMPDYERQNWVLMPSPSDLLLFFFSPSPPSSSLQAIHDTDSGLLSPSSSESHSVFFQSPPCLTQGTGVPDARILPFGRLFVWTTRRLHPSHQKQEEEGMDWTCKRGDGKQDSHTKRTTDRGIGIRNRRSSDHENRKERRVRASDCTARQSGRRTAFTDKNRKDENPDPRSGKRGTSDDNNSSS